MLMLNACVAAGATPLAAVSVPANVPPAPGVPLMTPVVALRVSPGGNAPLVTENVGAGEHVAATVKAYATLKVPFGGDALVNAGAWATAAVLVNAKFALRAPTVAVTVNEPTVALAAKDGAVATPETLLTAWTTFALPVNVPEAPDAGAVKVIDRPGSG